MIHECANESNTATHYGHPLRSGPARFSRPDGSGCVAAIVSACRHFVAEYSKVAGICVFFWVRKRCGKTTTMEITNKRKENEYVAHLEETTEPLFLTSERSTCPVARKRRPSFLDFG